MSRNKPSTKDEPDQLWARHHAAWRDPAQIASGWSEASATPAALLQYRASKDWWSILEQAQITLFVTREYEHLIMALTVLRGRPHLSFMRMPHPSGLVVNRRENRVYVASTRNPNQVFELRPLRKIASRLDAPMLELEERPLVPVRARFYPGSTYLHDLALFDDVLYGNAVGENAVVELPEQGPPKRVWWPRCIDVSGGPVFGQNHLQLNSIASAGTVETSFFSASTDRIGRRRPGHVNFPVDRRGVIFSGESREPVVFGLTRPHSARIHRKKLWVANSGYGELGFARGERLEVTTRLSGWTRGLCFRNEIAFVGTSRVLARFQNYAPGLDLSKSRCGLHAVNTRTGRVLASLVWPNGNQIFAIDWASNRKISGFPFSARASKARAKRLFYAYQL